MKKSIAGCAIIAMIVFVGAPSTATASEMPAGPQALAVESDGSIVVARSDPDEILVFSPTAQGDAAPRQIIGGYRSDIISPRSVALDRRNDIFVLVHHNGCDAIVEFTSTASGDPNPTAEIFGDKTRLCQPVSAIAVDGEGGIFVAHDDGDAVLYFSPGSDGDVAPATRIFGVTHAALHGVNGLAIDKDDLLVSSIREKTENDMQMSGGNFISPDIHYPPDIRVFGIGATGDAEPNAVIDLDVWSIGASDGAVLAVPADQSGPRPEIDLYSALGNHIRAISGNATSLVAPVGVSGDQDGRIYALDDRCIANSYQMLSAAVLVFRATARGDASPERQISGRDTGLSCP
jgi:hypothetical protein